MPKSHKRHKFILCIIGEVTNYLITAPIYQSRSEEIGEVLCTRLHNYGPGQCIYVSAHELPVQKVWH